MGVNISGATVGRKFHAMSVGFFAARRPQMLTHSFENTVSMLQRRGLPVKALADMDRDKLWSLAQEQGALDVSSPEDGVRLVYLFGAKTSVADTRPYLDGPQALTVFVVAEKPARATLDSVAAEFERRGRRVEIFTFDETLLSVEEHRLVPSYKRLSTVEAGEVCAAFHARPSQLPAMMHTDPVARRMGLVPGDVVRIETERPGQGTTVTYRQVVQA
jgi:DNA-directed RNA polymerase subunit H (RpoH/RPB5)